MGSLILRSMLIFEAEEGLPEQMELFEQRSSVELTTLGNSYAKLVIPPASFNLTATCRDAIAMVVRGGFASSICTPRGESVFHNMTIFGIRANDMLVAAVVENVNTGAKLLRDLGQLPADVMTSEGVTPLKKRIYDAVASGPLLRVIVLRIEQQNNSE